MGNRDAHSLQIQFLARLIDEDAKFLLGNSKGDVDAINSFLRKRLVVNQRTETVANRIGDNAIYRRLRINLVIAIDVSQSLVVWKSRRQRS